MTCSGLGISLYRDGDDEELEELREEEQLVFMSQMRSVVVPLSATSRNTSWVEDDWKVAAAMAPPGRLELLGSPY